MLYNISLKRADSCPSHTEDNSDPSISYSVDFSIVSVAVLLNDHCLSKTVFFLISFLVIETDATKVSLSFYLL